MDILVFSACFAIIAIASKQIGQNLVKTGIPLISGFLLTGIISGPYILNLISVEAALNLRFVDEISLGFIAFAAGGELYIKELKTRLKTIAWVTTGLVVCTFSLTGLTFFFLSGFIPFMQTMPVSVKIVVSILAGAIMVARSPSSAIAIVNELRAKGLFTQTVLGVTIIMDVVVIILFAVNSSIADVLLSGLKFNFGFILFLMLEIGASFIIGFFVGKIILLILLLPIQKALKTGLILLMGYLVFVFSSEIRKFTHDTLFIEVLLEPLLICMVAGFLVSNTSRYRKEFLKILFDIGPPIYIAFFTLTGASLSLDIVLQTWPIAMALFFTRAIAIFIGSFIGGTLAKNPMKDNTISWMAYITQAGVSLGLAKEVVVEFPEWGNPFAAIIISVVVLNQIIGPLLFKYAIKVMREDHPKAVKETEFKGVRNVVIFGSDGQAFALAMSLISQGWSVKIAVTHMNNNHDKNLDIKIYQLSELSLSELKKIKCHHAEAIVAMLSDEENIKICEISYEYFGTQTIIARLNDRSNFAYFQALDVLIVDPSTAIVSLLDHFVQSPAAASLLMGLDKDRSIVDLSIKNPNLFGLALRDLRLPFDTIIMSVRRRGVLFIPHGFTRLEAGDLVTVVGSLNSLKEITLRFDVNQEEALLQIVEKATAKELIDHSVQTEVKDIITSKRSFQKDRFDLLVEKSLVLDLKEAMNKGDFFELVSQVMSDLLNISPSVLNDLLIKREEEITTVLAPGLAIPHIIIDGEKKFFLLLARCRKGIEFSKSKPVVSAAFVLVGSKDERRFHLQALSAIARIVLDPRFEKKWMRAKSRTALKSVIISANQKHEV